MRNSVLCSPKSAACLALALVAWLVAGPAASFAGQATSENNERLKEALRRYPQADVNGDGILTMEEALKARQELPKKQGGGEAAGAGAGARAEKGASAGAPKPTFANVKYGPDERNVLDFWKAESAEPSPLVVFIHGGGFIGGDKAMAGGTAIRTCLDAGVSFMSINYRFRAQAPIQDILRDAARAIQFVRFHAEDYHIDPKRVASYGGSAGAGTSLWLAVHADLADPKNTDPVLRQSSRLSAAGCLNGQATYDLTEWEGLIGPFKQEWRQTPNERAEFYHFKSEEDFKTPEGQKILDDCSMLRLISRDDAPIFMACGMPDAEPANRGQYLHHPRHMQAVKKACDAAGVECVTVPRENFGKADQLVLDFFFKHLKVKPAKAEAAAPPEKN